MRRPGIGVRRGAITLAAVAGIVAPSLASAQFGQQNTTGFFDRTLPFEGPYFGIHAAATLPSVAMEVGASGFDVDDVSFDEGDATLSFSTDAVGARGELFVGAGLQSQSLYYGAEINYALGHAMADDALEAAEGLTAQVSDGYGLSVRLGGVLEEGTSMLYGRLSYQVRNLEVQAESGGDQASDDTTFVGIGVGVGLEYRSTQLPVMMRVEGNLYQYGDEDLFSGAHEVEFTEAAMNLGVGYAW
ncbi:outer membrane protein [Halorhodospira halophila]|uniref:Outer membrane protein beta-barrel domain-containing protein n=1 Tax=Halorhodospira halophila (strain DSM 244 / SL1) TaxID=349124 RepID=A1WUD4_HALHL|nr:hypothetical protein [Halorhodospira halophila]ABM61296.1 hypothetical protein Hhal_0509 [Halorhodospira halophila SL1]MBK1729122.1 hypothetical protein [Halorhodospira halophila]